LSEWLAISWSFGPRPELTDSSGNRAILFQALTHSQSHTVRSHHLEVSPHSYLRTVRTCLWTESWGKGEYESSVYVAISWNSDPCGM
jgi:hypothetical protein